MKLSPRIIQAMEVLQLATVALEERVDAELQANPVLELKDGGADEARPEDAPDDRPERGEQDLVVDPQSNDSDDFERLADLTAEYGSDVTDDPPRRTASADAPDQKFEAMANTPARGESLNEHLMDQWAFIEVDDAIKAAGEHLINEVDEDGYIRTPLEDLAERHAPEVKPVDLRKALALVQKLDPIGIGARDLKECLLLQLRAEADAGRDVSLETDLVNRFLRDIEMNRLPAIAQRTHRPVEDIKAALENLSHLDPRPGRLVGGASAPVIRPDAIVDLDEDGNVVVSMPDGHTPRLRISRSYQRMAQDRSTDRPTRQFLQNHVRSAQWLISAIRQRQDTIRRVVTAIFDFQTDFLLQGREALKPLPMASVAETVGVHVATVSRAVAGKYVQTPRGIFPLRMFFSGGTTTAEGDDVAWDAVKAKLQEIVDAEDKLHPLSDDQLAAELKNNGMTIARRTVAKYRGLLEIPPARKRREF
jgi:RNA polymerase sigma-54 factor